jgi:ubiquinol-cytochrome c reductase cytochrome c1 subunit
MFTLRTATSRLSQVRNAATQAAAPATSNAWRAGMGLAGATLVGSSAALMYAESLPVLAEEEMVHPPHQHWDHKGYFETFDHASVKRGYEVYKQVCAACHSMERIAFRNLVDVIYTEDEAKAIAAEYDCVNKEPNDQGEIFKRPGKLFDYFPSPYANEQESRASNGGAYPPDLTVIAKARHGGEDYIFSLLTGYCDPPAGVTVAEGQHYNPYFPGGAISMGAPLYDEVIEYEDGTEANTSQLAKDVATFLCWTAEPEHDERKQMGLKAMVVLSFLTVLAFYYKRHTWASLKTRRIVYKK